MGPDLDLLRGGTECQNMFMPSKHNPDPHKIKRTLEEHHKSVVDGFYKKHAETFNFAKKHSLVLAGAAMLTAAAIGIDHIHARERILHKHQQETKNLNLFVEQLNPLLAGKNKLNEGEEEVIAEALSEKFGLDLKVRMEGNRLNEIFGYVGKEQHLYRWRGDSLSRHDSQKEGIAPLQGAFKDFETADQEKYYVAVQLHELPDWNKEWPRLKPWYRFRKVFVYNPVNQKGVVAVIGDSGPARFTGKIFGGSPELMEYLQMKDGRQKGKAIILFVDDTRNKVALGPVDPASGYLASTQ